MDKLFLADLKDLSEEELVRHIVEYYEVDRESVEKYDILVAYECVGGLVCNSSSFFLLEDKTDNKLYEVHGSHCSCCRFEGQWKPEETTLEYLKSDKFIFWYGGCDNESTKNKKKVFEYISDLKKRD